MLITCFAFCLEVWDVIWKMRFKFALCRDCLRRFILVIMLDHLIVNFSDRLVSFLTNDACSFSIIEWRMSVLDLSSDVYDATSDLTKHFIKLDESDSSNLTKHLIKLDENDSSNLTKATHRTWRKRRHLIKLDESVISSNLRSSSHQTFEKRDSLSTFWWAISCNDAWYDDIRNLILQKIIFCAKINVCVKLLWWMSVLMKMNADIIQLFLKRKASSCIKAVDK
jgi:hypothetical protein